MRDSLFALRRGTATLQTGELHTFIHMLRSISNNTLFTAQYKSSMIKSKKGVNAIKEGEGALGKCANISGTYINF